MRSFRRLFIVMAEVMQVVSILAWTIGGIWAGGRLADFAIDYGYVAKTWPRDDVFNAGLVAGGVVGFAISATAAAIVFAFAQIELNTRDVARYYIERRKSEMAPGDRRPPPGRGGPDRRRLARPARRGGLLGRRLLAAGAAWPAAPCACSRPGRSPRRASSAWTSTPTPHNEASQRVAEKAGFTREGLLRELRYRHGEREDAVRLLAPGEDLSPASRGRKAVRPHSYGAGSRTSVGEGMDKEQEKAAKARDTALNGALTQIERQFGAGSIMKMGDDAAQVRVSAVPTGALSLDLALGVGGLPRGRIVEVFGPESSGKTTLLYHVLANAQKMGGICAFIDAEHAMDPAYAKRIGVDIDELLVSQPDHGEQALEIADLLIRSGAVDVVAIDSVAALTPKAELEGAMGDQTVGVQARMMSQAMRKLAGNLNRANTMCVFTNQIREKVGVMFGSPETQPGGRALKFYSSARLDIRRIETLKEGTEAVGNRVRVKVVKNKCAAPFRQAEFDIEYGEGISAEGCLIDLGLEHDIVRKSGSFFSYGEERLGQGRNNAKGYLREHPEVSAEIERKVYEAVGAEPPMPVVGLPDQEDAPAAPGSAPEEAEEQAA